MDSTLPTDADKAALRRRLRALRRGLARDGQQASERAAALAPLHLWPAAPVVAGYLAMRDEIDPGPLLRRLSATGARIVLPAVAAWDAPLVFRAAGEPDGLVTDLLGLPAPPPSSPALVPTLVIAPLLAFDRTGGRLGQGGGYYDRTLRDLRLHGAVTVVGLAFAGQEVERTPMGPCDERLDGVLTERGYIEVGKG
ncbi:MAG TPA: 5-formyltetrahydrofolate cyclo-ligase [Caulobacteraceae bacterium]|nr:5-formyltetrahydrofolate cyclo-ligase [Caulobacteraceae bacterium]